MRVGRRGLRCLWYGSAMTAAAQDKGMATLGAELDRLRKTLAHAQGEKASELERMERQHAVTLARQVSRVS